MIWNDRLSARHQETRSLLLQMRHPSHPASPHPIPTCRKPNMHRSLLCVHCSAGLGVSPRTSTASAALGLSLTSGPAEQAAAVSWGRGWATSTGAPSETRSPLVGAQTGTDMWRCSTRTLTDTHTYMHTLRHVHTHHPCAVNHTRTQYTRRVRKQYTCAYIMHAHTDTRSTRYARSHTHRTDSTHCAVTAPWLQTRKI